MTHNEYAIRDIASKIRMYGSETGRAVHILDAIKADPYKYLPGELFGPTLKDTLETVAKIKAYKKEISDLKAELDKKESEFNESELLWITGLHEEVTAKLNAEDRANAAEVQAAGLQVEINGLRLDEEELCGRLNAVCDEFGLDVPDCYSDAFRKALKVFSGGVGTPQDLRDEQKAHDMTAQLLENARIDNDQLRTELRHAEERYTAAEKELESLSNDYRCMKNHRDELVKSSGDDAVKLMKERDEAKQELSNFAGNVMRAVEEGCGGLWFVTNDKLLKELTNIVRELKTRRDDAIRIADKMRPELAHLRTVVREHERGVEFYRDEIDCKEAAFAREEELINGMYALINQHSERCREFGRKHRPNGSVGEL